ARMVFETGKRQMVQATKAKLMIGLHHIGATTGANPGKSKVQQGIFKVVKQHHKRCFEGKAPLIYLK
ncbi:hypothetical protein, partial [Pseudomonas aeruginosa]|uniref:hypothetical protein n=1 Tax=Pseudomonas aeruginosa TaxID=287 RepID=UPI002B411CF1